MGCIFTFTAVLRNDACYTTLWDSINSLFLLLVLLQQYSIVHTEVNDHYMCIQTSNVPFRNITQRERDQSLGGLCILSTNMQIVHAVCAQLLGLPKSPVLSLTFLRYTKISNVIWTRGTLAYLEQYHDEVLLQCMYFSLDVYTFHSYWILSNFCFPKKRAHLLLEAWNMTQSGGCRLLHNFRKLFFYFSERQHLIQLMLQVLRRFSAGFVEHR